MEIVKVIYLLLILGLCVITDFRYKKIKNYQVAAIFAGALVFLLYKGNGQVVIESLGMMMLFAAVLFPIYCMGALGAGDVKLLCVTALYIGKGEIETFLIGVLISSGLFSLVKLFYYGTFFKRVEYFLAYVKCMISTGKVESYGIPKQKEEVLTLALPVFIGAFCWGFF